MVTELLLVVGPMGTPGGAAGMPFNVAGGDGSVLRISISSAAKRGSVPHRHRARRRTPRAIGG
jgi:hypothetical protein